MNKYYIAVTLAINDIRRVETFIVTFREDEVYDNESLDDTAERAKVKICKSEGYKDAKVTSYTWYGNTKVFE